MNGKQEREYKAHLKQSYRKCLTAGGCTLGILRIEIKHVNHKTCVHQMKQV